MSPSNMINAIVVTRFVLFIGLGNFLCSIMQPMYAIQFDQGKGLEGHNCLNDGISSGRRKARRTWVEHNRPNFGRLQQVMVKDFTDDETSRRLQERFASVRRDQRPLFVPL